MKEADMPIPHLFRCPISLDLFTDPVTLCTGQTYDRSSIEKWLSAGNQTCPVTMQKLQDPSMVPNHTLRHLIDHWLQIRRHSDPSRRQTATGHESPDPSAAAALKHCLVSHHSTLENKLQTVETIRVLSDELPSRNSCLIQLDFFPLLLGLVFSEISRENLMFVEKALVCALKLLPFCSLRPLNMLKEESKMDFFLELFNHSSSVTIKKSLCQFVEAISSSLETKELAVILGTNQTLVKGIVLLLQINSGATEFGIRAISALCSHESNRRNLVTEGAVDGLIAYIVAGERQEIRNLAATAVAALELLLGVEGAKEAVIRHPSGFDALVKMVFRVSDHGGSESAVNSLAIVCSDSVEARGGAIRAGVLTQLLLLLQSQCGGRTKTKARMLLKLLRSTWAEDSTYL